MVSRTVFRLPFRKKEQLDTTSYRVRFNFLFFINFKPAFTSNSFNIFSFPVIFSVIQTAFTNNKLVEIKRTETNYFGRNNRLESLEQFQLCQQTETCPIYFNFNHYVKMTIRETVISVKNTNRHNRTAISKIRTHERNVYDLSLKQGRFAGNVCQSLRLAVSANVQHVWNVGNVPGRVRCF